jgi:hypothetical protein
MKLVVDVVRQMVGTMLELKARPQMKHVAYVVEGHMGSSAQIHLRIGWMQMALVVDGIA